MKPTAFDQEWTDLGTLGSDAFGVLEGVYISHVVIAI